MFGLPFSWSLVRMDHLAWCLDLTSVLRVWVLGDGLAASYSPASFNYNTRSSGTKKVLFDFIVLTN